MNVTVEMTLTEFLLARIAEDEGDARDYSDDDSPGTWRRWGEDVSAAHRRIVAELDAFVWEGTDGTVAGVAQSGRIFRYLALPYADHPDYREEWRP